MDLRSALYLPLQVRYVRCDPFDLIRDIFEPFPSSLYTSTVVAFESVIRMIQLATKPERPTTQPVMQTQAQPPISLLARPQPEPTQPSL